MRSAIRGSWVGGALVVAIALASPAAAQLAPRPLDVAIPALESPARLPGLKIDQVIARLQLKPGVVVADLGAGAGVFSLPFAKAVGPSGKVYAVEVEQGLVTRIANKAREQNVPNVHALLGQFTDPRLPARDVDVAFFHDVLHHIQDRAGYLKTVAQYVKPAGRIAIIDFPAEKSPHRDDPAMVITKAQVTGWLAAAGFVPAEDIQLIDDKWFVVYKRR